MGINIHTFNDQTASSTEVYLHMTHICFISPAVPGTKRIEKPLTPVSLKEDSKGSIFDAIKKPPSVAMEKIKNSTAATLDRMAMLQARYRQHRETMNPDNSSDKSRRTSTTSTVDSNVSSMHAMHVIISHYFFALYSLFVCVTDSTWLTYFSMCSLFHHSLTVHPFRNNINKIKHWRKSLQFRHPMSLIINSTSCISNNKNNKIGKMISDILTTYPSHYLWMYILNFPFRMM